MEQFQRTRESYAGPVSVPKRVESALQRFEEKIYQAVRQLESSSPACHAPLRTLHADMVERFFPQLEHDINEILQSADIAPHRAMTNEARPRTTEEEALALPDSDYFPKSRQPERIYQDSVNLPLRRRVSSYG